MTNRIEQADWTVHWKLTESSGLMVYLSDFRGARVLWEGSLPYVTVDHQRPELTLGDDDGDGSSHGPFWVPLGARTLASDIRVNSFRGGFELAADFGAGPYRYTQLWRFHADGRFEPWLTIYGSGVHDAHTYHPHWRFDFDLNGAPNDMLEQYTDGAWTKIDEEGWLPFMGNADPTGNAWRQVDSQTGAQVTIRPQKWEDAELFAIRYHEGEWAPFSPRSASDAQSFPAAYVGKEPLAGFDVMLWYVTHVHYDAAFPFTAGPWMRVSGV